VLWIGGLIFLGVIACIAVYKAESRGFTRWPAIVLLVLGCTSLGSGILTAGWMSLELLCLGAVLVGMAAAIAIFGSLLFGKDRNR
jgi:hypothetical protein